MPSEAARQEVSPSEGSVHPENARSRASRNVSTAASAGAPVDAEAMTAKFHRLQRHKMRELVLSLLIWLGAPDLPPPQVFVVAPQELEKISGIGAGAAAVYNCHFRTVFLSAPFDRENVWKRSVLVHELEHHKQCLEGRFRLFPENLRELEGSAYAVQLHYLKKHGVLIDARLEELLTRHGL